MTEQKTIYEKWATDSEEAGGPLRFHEKGRGAKPVTISGFTEDEMIRYFGGPATNTKKSAMAENTVLISKADDDKHLVFGWASVALTADGEELEDRQHDVIDPEDLEDAAYDYVLKFRDTGEEHLPSMRKKGKLVESCVFTLEKQRAMGIPEGILPVAWWIGFYIEDDDTWQRIKNGTYKMFSIEGQANREPVEKGRRDYNEYPEYGMWLEENLDASDAEQKAAKEYYSTHKEEARRDYKYAPPKLDKAYSRYDIIEEISTAGVSRYDTIEEAPLAKSFDEIIKFNPYHDARGRFTSGSGATSFTIRTRDPGKQRMADTVHAREIAKPIVSAAKAREPALTKTMQGVAAAAGGEMVGLDYAVKGTGSLTRKIRDEATEQGISMAEAAGGMKDVNRYTMQLTEDNFVSGYNKTI